MSLPSAPPPNSFETETADLFDFRQFEDYGGFVVGAIKRHTVLACLAFFGTLCAGLVFLWVMPKTYHAESNILAQRNQVIPTIVNPRRTIPWDADSPTRAAAETVLRNDNLVALVKQTNLIDHWELSRAPILRVKDFLRNLLVGQPTEQEKLDSLVGLLEKRLQVSASSREGTLRIEIDWPDAQMAYQLVEAAQQNFLETRHSMEVSNISEAISILESHASTVHDSIKVILDEIHSSETEISKSSVKGKTAPSVRSFSIRTKSPQSRELDRIGGLLEVKRRTIADLEASRRQKQNDLQTQLLEAKSTYAAAHPMIMNIEESIKAISKDSPQLASLKREEAELMEDYELARIALSHESDARKPGSSAPAVPLDTKAALKQNEIESLQQIRESVANEGGNLEYARAQLQIASHKYEDLIDRISAAKLELQTARVAFKYRYSVIRPAQIPNDPIKPKPALVLSGAVFAGVFFVFLLCTLADLRRGRIIEAWQVERFLKLPVLAEVKWN